MASCHEQSLTVAYLIPSSPIFSEVLILEMLVVFIVSKQEDELNNNFTIVPRNNLNHGLTLKKARVIHAIGAGEISNQSSRAKPHNYVCMWR